MFKAIIKTASINSTATFDTIAEATRYIRKAYEAFPYIGVESFKLTIEQEGLEVLHWER